MSPLEAVVKLLKSVPAPEVHTWAGGFSQAPEPFDRTAFQPVLDAIVANRAPLPVRELGARFPEPSGELADMLLAAGREGVVIFGKGEDGHPTVAPGRF